MLVHNSVIFNIVFTSHQPSLKVFSRCVAYLGETETAATQSTVTTTTSTTELLETTTTATTTTTTTTTTTMESATTTFSGNATDDYVDLDYSANILNAPNAQKSLEADSDESRLDPLTHGIG